MNATFRKKRVEGRSGKSFQILLLEKTYRRRNLGTPYECGFDEKGAFRGIIGGILRQKCFAFQIKECL
jgi:hypothetical protein